jgi:hypothetical protein
MSRKTKEPAFAADVLNIDPERLASDKANLDAAWTKITDGRQEEAEGHKLWIEGTLELINILHDACESAGNDQAFGRWLRETGYGERITHQDRAALLNMARDLQVTREVLQLTDRRSWRLIWEEEIRPRFTNAGQPADSAATTRRPKRGKGANGDPKPEWLRDNRKWFNNQVASVNAVIEELDKIMEDCNPEQHSLLASLEPTLLLDATQSLEKKAAEFVDWIDTPFEKAADASRSVVTSAPKPKRRTTRRDVQAGA